MGRAKEMFLYAEEDAWRASPEYQAMLEERRRDEAAAVAEQDRREKLWAQRHRDEWREWLKVRPLLPALIDLWAEKPFDFEAFLMEVGRCPSPDHVVARKDETGEFDRGNMRWVHRLGEAGGDAPPRLDGKCYSTREFAELVGRSAYTVRQMCLRGIILADRDERAGRTGEWRIPPAELVRWRQDGPFKAPRTRS